MTKSRRKKTGRPPRHGGYSIVYRDDVIKRHPKLRQYLQNCRDGLVRDIAGTEEGLSEQQRIMIDRIISRLSICRLIECYIEKYGAFRRDRIKRDKVLELEPALGVNYLAFSNSIDRALVALGLARVPEPGQDLAQIVAEIDAENEAKKAEREAAGQGVGQDEDSEGGEIASPESINKEISEEEK